MFAGLTALVGGLTWYICRKQGRRSDASTREYFLANRGLSWVFVAGSITLTNLSTDQLVGMNGNQMFLLAWWELSAVAGLLILAKIFLPIYYKYQCTTTTELLERRYNSHYVRATVAALFLMTNVLIYLPMVLYTGSLFMQSMFGLEVSIPLIAIFLAVVGSAYAILGGLRAVAVSDTLSGVGLLSMGIVIAYLALAAIDFDLSDIPAERLTLIGSNESPIPWHTLLTGMIFIQVFYWSTNQAITQRAMASKTVREAQKGVLVAAAIRLCLVPIMVVVPGVCAYKLYGDVGDAAFGKLVGDVLPPYLSGVVAAVMMAAALTTFNSVLNSSAALYVCDLHQRYINPECNVRRLNTLISMSFVVVSLSLLPFYIGADSIVNLVQQLNGLFSMPILSAFIVGLMFRGVHAAAVIVAVSLGVGLYAVFTFVWTPLHYIHLMFITLWCCVGSSLIINRYVFGGSVQLAFALPSWTGVVAKT